MTSEGSDEEQAAAGVWDASDPGHAELVQMRIRLIAAENLLLAILAEAPEAVHRKVRERAAEMQPRKDASEHPLTEHAASEMLKLLARADRR